ncbi:hypothetical protein NDU88_000915 [Pleurodeles waltl]|uniref:Uncharacterized protein n=1 Tax=Pleurodeles waltl TaxID=8319 RepID=A0AAV7SBF1_PLEWA|nr:hypothetical protein NDU88_000915 [Pleurodeles waltl]
MPKTRVGRKRRGGQGMKRAQWQLKRQPCWNGDEGKGEDRGEAPWDLAELWDSVEVGEYWDAEDIGSTEVDSSNLGQDLIEDRGRPSTLDAACCTMAAKGIPLSSRSESTGPKETRVEDPSGVSLVAHLACRASTQVAAVVAACSLPQNGA